MYPITILTMCIFGAIIITLMLEIILPEGLTNMYGKNPEPRSDRLRKAYIPLHFITEVTIAEAIIIITHNIPFAIAVMVLAVLILLNELGAEKYCKPIEYSNKKNKNNTTSSKKYNRQKINLKK